MKSEQVLIRGIIKMNEAVWLEKCREWSTQIKYLSDEATWGQKPQNKNYLIATSRLLDEDRKEIPHLYFKGECNIGKRGEYVSYGLMYRHGGETRRVFMLEVYPQHIRSHMEEGLTVYGPHIHFGCQDYGQITKAVKDRVGLILGPRWVGRFIRHSRVLSSSNASISTPLPSLMEYSL